ncbi:unnamed protein product [marine sediment metagenome]|uniref:DUF3168 domain-containing protein n=1 Tax=marine sediment metagenome TaxID=412755 RepID=X0UEW6_9ZZZZ
MAERKTIFRDLLFFLKDQLSTNITDPIDAIRGTNSAFIMTSFPEREVKYPLITLEITNVEESRAGMQTSFMDISLTVEIRIWSKSVAQSDKLAQEILDELADIQFTTSTGSVANDFHDFTVGSVVRVDSPGKGGIKSRIIQISYRFFNL